MPDNVIAAQTTPKALSQRQFENWTTDAGQIDTALFIGTREEPLDYDALIERAASSDWRGLLIAVAALDDITELRNSPTATRTTTPCLSSGGSQGTG